MTEFVIRLFLCISARATVRRSAASIFCCFLWVSAGNTTELKFGYAGTLCPVVCNLKEDGQAGFMPDILRTIGGPDGVTIKVVDLPKARLLKELKRGTVDFLLLPPAAVQRVKLLTTAVPAAYYTIGVLRRRDHAFRFTGPESLKQVTWGVVSGERWRGPYQRHIEENRGRGVFVIFGDNAYARLVEMVVKGRVDVVMNYAEMLERKRRHSSSADLLTVDRTRIFGNHVPLFLAFDPDGPAKRWAAFFTDGLRRIIRNGQLADILKAYEIVDWGTTVSTHTRD